MQKCHRFEAEFVCILCKRCFSVFIFFTKHVSQHEEMVAIEKSKQVDEILALDSQKQNETNFLKELTNAPESSPKAVLPQRNVLPLTSFLGNSLPPTHLWQKAKYVESCENWSLFLCKYKNCETITLTLENYSSHLSNYHGSASSFECVFC